MSDLNFIISSETLFQVDVELKPIAQVLILLNEHIKNQEKRISDLETQLRNIPNLREFHELQTKTITSFNDIYTKLDNLIVDHSKLEETVNTNNKDTLELIEQKASEAFINSNQQLRHTYKQLDAAIGIVRGCSNEAFDLAKANEGDLKLISDDLMIMKQRIGSSKTPRDESARKSGDGGRPVIPPLPQASAEKPSQGSYQKSVDSKFKQIDEELTKDVKDEKPIVIDAPTKAEFESSKQVVANLEKLLREMSEKVAQLEKHAFTLEKVSSASDKKKEKQDLSSTQQKTISPSSSAKNIQIISEPHITEIDVKRICSKLLDEHDIPGLRDNINRAAKLYDQSTLAVDRKIDRDYVERLFDKFRSLLQKMNERINEIGSLVEGFASKDDFDMLCELFEKTKICMEKSAGSKKSVCLLCGKQKVRLQGEIPYNAGIQIGIPPVSHASQQVAGTELVYGENQAFIRGDFPSQSSSPLPTLNKPKK